MKIREKWWFNKLLKKHPIENYKGIDQSDYEIVRELEIISIFLENIFSAARFCNVLYILNPEEISVILEYLSETKSLVKSEKTLDYLRYIEGHCKEIYRLCE